MNQYGDTVMFTNTSTTTCTMIGYPGLQLADADGPAMDVPVHRGSGYIFADHGPRLAPVAPGQTASFAFGGPEIAQPSGALCPLAHSIRVIPPNDYTQLTVAARAAGCRSSGVSVTAVNAGSSSSRPSSTS